MTPPLPFAWVSKFAGRHTPANGVIMIEGEREKGREMGGSLRPNHFSKIAALFRLLWGPKPLRESSRDLGGGWYLDGGMGSWQPSSAKPSGIPADEAHHHGLTLQTPVGPFSWWSLSFLRKMGDSSTSSPHGPQHTQTPPLVGRVN